MAKHMRGMAVAFGLSSLVGLGCGGLAVDGYEEDDLGSSWQALMADGEVSAIAPIAPMAPSVHAGSGRFCEDCSREPLAFWRLDDCNALSTELSDAAYSSRTSHPAFRSVSAACVDGASGQGVELAREDDVVYAPDQRTSCSIRG